MNTRNLASFALSQPSSFNPPVVETQLLSSETSATKASLPKLNTTGNRQEGEMGMYLIVFEPNYKSREEPHQEQEGKRAEP